MLAHRSLAPVLGMIAVLLVVGSAAAQAGNGNDGIDRNCSDFATWEEAQAYWVADGGSINNDVDDLDGDDPAQGEPDGRVCETNPGYPGDAAFVTPPAQPTAAPPAPTSPKAGPSPTVAPAAPSGGTTALPSTGTGTEATEPWGPALLVLAALAAAGGAVAIVRAGSAPRR